MHNSSWPYPIGWPSVPIFFTISPATSDSISFSSFMASTMHNTWPTSTMSPSLTNGGAPGEGASYSVPTMGDFTMCRFSGAGETGAAGAAEDGVTAGDADWGTVTATYGISGCVCTTVRSPARLIFT